MRGSIHSTSQYGWDGARSARSRKTSVKPMRGTGERDGNPPGDLVDAIGNTLYFDACLGVETPGKHKPDALGNALGNSGAALAEHHQSQSELAQVDQKSSPPPSPLPCALALAI